MQTKSEKKCAICRSKVSSAIYYGEWMQRSEIVVHYYCLLLSTNLPQNGEDNSGILGFLLRDIRQEIINAGKRICVFCKSIGASIRCDKCKVYFHIECGIQNLALFTFRDYFKSYCYQCTSLSSHQKLAKRTWKDSLCYICRENLGLIYNPVQFLHGPCCNKGYVHRECLQKYALSAGYYLRCIWCRSESFRDSIRLHGVFVPDRDAQWELERGAFRDLHRGHKRCDYEPCLCPRGREYESGKTWTILLCKLCGSSGVHVPGCIPKSKTLSFDKSNFVCDTCAIIGRRVEEVKRIKLSQQEEQSMCHRDEESDEDTTDIGSRRMTCHNDESFYTFKKFETVAKESEPNNTTAFSQDTPYCVEIDEDLKSNDDNDDDNDDNDNDNDDNDNDNDDNDNDNDDNNNSIPSQNSNHRSVKPQASEPNESNLVESLVIEILSSDEDCDGDKPKDDDDDNDDAIMKSEEIELMSSNNKVCDENKARDADAVAPKSEEIPEQQITSSQPLIYVKPNFFEMTVYERDGPTNILGECRIRVNLNEARFAGKTTEEEIIEVVEESDIVERTSDRGVFDVIDQFLEEFNPF